MKKRRYKIKSIEESGFFQDKPMAIAQLEQEYFRQYETAWRRILDILGFRFRDSKLQTEFTRAMMQRAATLYVTLGKAAPLSPELKEIVQAPDCTIIERAFQKSGFKSWEDVKREIFSDPKYAHSYRFEKPELRYCLVLDMIFNAILRSEDSLLGKGKKEAAVLVMRSDFMCDDDFARMIEFQLGMENSGKKLEFCRHGHYFPMAESMLDAYESYINEKIADHTERTGRANRLNELPLEELLQPYRFLSDRKPTELPTGQALLRMLVDYYCEMAQERVCPSKEMLSRYSAFAGSNGGSKARLARIRNKRVNREYLKLYAQMPYSYIAEWIVQNAHKGTARGNEALCPLFRPHSFGNYEKVRVGFDEKSATWRVNGLKRLKCCNIISDYDDGDEALNDINAFKSTGNNVKKDERRIRQYCLFRYVAMCIERLSRITDRLVSMAATISETEKRRAEREFLLELFRMQYLVQKSKLFSGFHDYMKRKAIAAYGGNGFEEVIGRIRPSLFWDTYLMYLIDKSGYKRVPLSEFKATTEQYENALNVAARPEKDVLGKLLMELSGIRSEEPSYGFGMDYLSYVGTKLQVLLHDKTLKTAAWDEIDVILEKEYTRKRKSKDN